MISVTFVNPSGSVLPRRLAIVGLASKAAASTFLRSLTVAAKRHLKVSLAGKEDAYL
jgi:hypothetical protein